MIGDYLWILYGSLLGNELQASYEIQSEFHPGNQGPKCPLDLPLSCSNSTAIPDSCCFEYPGGIFLQSQFWDYIPSKSGLDDSEIENQLGPADKFTIHGLWPDNCRGGFEQFCDRDLEIDDVSFLLNSPQFNGPDRPIMGKELLSHLNRLWKSSNGDHEALWIHEYNKHGTCIKTIRPACYSRWENEFRTSSGISTTEQNDYQANKHNSVYDYFRISYNLYSKLDTFNILNSNGITPDENKTYSKLAIQQALDKSFGGKKVYFTCDQHNALSEVWYYHHLKGSLLNEEFVPMDSMNLNSRCRESGIKFFPKGYIPPANSLPTKPGRRGIVRVSGDLEGILIKNGRFMKNGTPVNFQLESSPFGGFYLKSRLGYCRVDPESQQLNCRYHAEKASQFDIDENEGYLGYSGSLNWVVKDVPRNTKRHQLPIYHSLTKDKNGSCDLKLKFIFM